MTIAEPDVGSRAEPRFEPADAAERRAAPATICYETDRLPAPRDPDWMARWRASLSPVRTLVVPPRQARTFHVDAGQAFRIRSVEGPQVGDLNLWNADDLHERFYSGKTRQLQASHLSTGDRLWSSLPSLRPLATITADSLAWYGADADGGRVHDVIGTRCDPYTEHRLTGRDYDRCCHSNLVRALADERGLTPDEAERHVHDVMNVFMCTGFTRDTGQYFMKASPVRPGDAIEFLAEIDLLGALSACPGGDCGSSHSSDQAACHPLQVEILAPDTDLLTDWRDSTASGYTGHHGMLV